MASDEHQGLVKGLIDSFKSKGLTIQCAAYDGYDECWKEGRHEPDVIAVDASGLSYIGEAETCDSLNDDDTKEQFFDFSNRQMNKDKRQIPFYIGIPQKCENDLRQTLTDLGLSTKNNIWYITF